MISVVVLLLIVIRWVEASMPNQYYGKTFYEYGISYQNKGRFSKAVSCFRKAIKHNPTLAEAYFSLGEILYLLSDYGQAEESLLKGTQLDPRSDQAFYLLGTIYYYKGDFNRAIVELQKGIRNQRFTYPNNYYYLMGLCSLEIEDLKLARSCVKEIKKYGGLPKLGDLLDKKIPRENEDDL